MTVGDNRNDHRWTSPDGTSSRQDPECGWNDQGRRWEHVGRVPWWEAGATGKRTAFLNRVSIDLGLVFSEQRLPILRFDAVWHGAVSASLAAGAVSGRSAASAGQEDHERRASAIKQTGASAANGGCPFMSASTIHAFPCICALRCPREPDDTPR